MDSEKRSWTVDIDPRVNAASSTANPKRKDWMVYVEQGANASTISTGVKNWMADFESRATDHSISSEEELWKNASIYKLPSFGRDLNPKAFTPMLVSLGPYHCDDNELRPLVMHKERALAHFIKRTGKSLDELVNAVKSVLRKLQDSYYRLDEKWRADEDGFLKLMIVDGCFMLEVLQYAANQRDDYSSTDPFFSKHGIRHKMPYIRRDMLLIENQLPLLLLKTLVSVQNHPDIPKGMESINSYIHNLVLKFLTGRDPPVKEPNLHDAPVREPNLRDHALDLFRRSLLLLPQSDEQKEPIPDPKQDTGVIRCARELYLSGVHFKTSPTKSFRDINFDSRKGILSLPKLVVDDATECILLNLIAYEHLHFNIDHDVTSYVCFMDEIINTADDVSLLQAKGIIQNCLGSDENVAQLFNRISKEVTDDPESPLTAVRKRVQVYCEKSWNSWKANLVQTYFRNPWSTLSLAAAVLLIVLTILQTGFTIYQSFKPNKNG